MNSTLHHDPGRWWPTRPELLKPKVLYPYQLRQDGIPARLVALLPRPAGDRGADSPDGVKGRAGAATWRLLRRGNYDLYHPKEAKPFDRRKIFSSPERHILQIFHLERYGFSVEEFRLKKQEPYRKAGAISGPIPASRNLESITRDF